MNRLLIGLMMILLASEFAGADVTLLKTPNKGIQPQVVMDPGGNVHLLYYEGDARGGNLMYIRRDAGKREFSAPVRVNSQPGSAIAAGTIRGGQIALGKGGRVHVAWNGAMKAEPKNALGGHPMLYARLADDGKSFEPQRNLMVQTSVLDGGGTLAADGQGNVYVAWHAVGKDSPKGEENRKVWVSMSTDEGRTFGAEKPVSADTGACGCCGMRGFADSKGRAYFLYRAASQKINRGMYALFSADHGKTFLSEPQDNWKINTCPMSSEAFAEHPAGGVYGAWDNDGQIYFRLLQDPAKKNDTTLLKPPGKTGDRQHPALAFNKSGEMLLAWTEGTGWNRGGAVAWQIYDKNMQPREAGRRAGAISVWGLPAVIVEADGNFTIVH